MNITELLITGYDGTRTLFAATLTTDGVKVIKPGTDEAVVGERWEEATTAFTAVRDLMIDLASTPANGAREVESETPARNGPVPARSCSAPKAATPS